MWLVLIPSSDCYVDPSNPDHVEKSKNGIPYASLVQFARSLVIQQLTHDIADFVDGMDLTVEWGEKNIGLEALQADSPAFRESCYQRARRYDELHPDQAGLGGIERSSVNLEQLWAKIASQEAKERRIEPLKQGRYLTRWRRVNQPEDPRTRDRPV